MFRKKKKDLRAANKENNKTAWTVKQHIRYSFMGFMIKATFCTSC